MPVDVSTIELLADLFPEGDWVEAMESGAFEERIGRLKEVATADLEVVMSGDPLTERYRGVEGLREAWANWLVPFESYRVEPDPDPVIGDDTAVFVARQLAVPKGVAQPIESEGAVAVFFRDGQVERIEFHLGREAALRSAGLAEEP